MKKKRSLSSVSLFILFAMMITIIVLIVVLNLVFQDPDNWRTLLFDLMGDLLSAIVIGLFVGLITKAITQKLFSVQINMKKMRDLGIDGVGTGISTRDDIEKMFGTTQLKKKYPCVIKMMFVTGNVFLRTFQQNIIESMDEGCEVQFLIASPDENNREYLERISYRYNDGQIDYQKEILEDALRTVKNIRERSKNPQNFKVRFYRDEYQNNIRISKYLIEGSHFVSYYWLNVQPLNKAAIDLSIALKGEYDNEVTDSTDEKDNLCLASERGFDLLWRKYEDTEQDYLVS